MGNKQSPSLPPPDTTSRSVITPSIATPHTLLQEYFPKNCKLIRAGDDDEENRKKQLEKLMNYKEKYLVSKCNGRLEQNLPEEIIVEILQYLELKSLIKLQTVSRNFRMYWTELPELWDKFAKNPKMMYIPMVNESMSVNFGYFHEFKQKLSNLHEKPTLNCNFKGHIFKTIVLGGKMCGKTIYHNRIFKDAPYSEEYVYTIGVDFSALTNQIHLQIQSWDTGGDERFRTIITNFFKNMKGHFYCFDLNDYESFETMKSIFQDWKEMHKPGEDLHSYFVTNNISFVLIGLKSDLEHKVPTDEIHEFLEKIEPMKDKTLHTSRVQYFELSSKQDCLSDLLFPFVYSYHQVMEPIYCSTGKGVG